MAGQVAALDADWVEFDPAQPAAMLPNLPDRAALVEWEGAPGAPPRRIWRLAYLRELLAHGLVAPEEPVEALLALARQHPLAHRPRQTLPELRPGPAAGREVALISRFGVEKFGGVEHFLLQMARLYRALGYRPIILGTRAERLGETGEVEGIPYAFLAETPEALFRFALQRRLGLIHVVSGLGFEVAAALRFLDVRIIFGVHFWRELFHPTTAHGGYFPHCPQGHQRRAEFEFLLSDADAVYANSEFTRDVVEAHFGPRVTVLPSLPDDAPSMAAPDAGARDVVLLANARMDKGFGMMLALSARLSARLPSCRFVALATQSDIGGAQAMARDAGLSNVEVLERVQDMQPLYARARAVLVPSYRFVETFSRVVIEAQREGIPVIGSDRGNLPYLLRESGVSLPEEPGLWAEELARLFEDAEYWRERSRRARENADRHRFAAQQGRLAQLLAGLDQPVLVAVGSGIGNVIHTTPLLRNLARRLGRPVDVVVAGDSPGALAVVANSAHVRHVFPLTDIVLRRRYALVFVLQSFGSLVPEFSAERVVHSREWDVFDASHALHEAEFNLASASALLGIPYDAEDVRACQMGELHRQVPPPRLLVGLHAGSKGGIWAAKRWPYFEELAQRLLARGIAVASFGTPEEHVPGTEDRTGGTVEEMARAMRDCSAFLANDSGVMNIANALGLPLVALFAPTAPRTRGPLGAQSVIIALDKPCAPCELAGPDGAFRQLRCRCISEITVEQVEAALLERLRAGEAIG
ncbi:glycosyltransferase family 9 protein [Sediminicoccus sp. KRV36]|uniref:glycosyltransferase family 9 protein n=1 Tax=Sediminicoccus sp. KRV36 TaxID=3133721 RepID=UPI00200E855B|nr:glycosyltransferase family 9 protein [Sediminicoccus rosea]UPY36957.1 glycosyltransferase [Sediminicoccus rosea]